MEARGRWFKSTIPDYVGQSNVGLARPFSPHHHVLGRQIQPGDRIDILLVLDDMSLAQAERKAIVTLKPSMNQQIPPPPRPLPGPLPGDGPLSAASRRLSEGRQLVDSPDPGY